MKPTVVVYKALPEPVLARLAAHFELLQVDPVGADGRAALSAALAHADGAIGSSTRIDAGMITHATRIKAFATVSVGVDQFDLDALAARGIVLMNTPDVLTETTADAVFALLLASARRVVELANYVRAGRWRGSITAASFGRDVHHKTIGIVGFGRIGQALAQRASAGFHMRVLYTSPRAVPRAGERYGAHRVELDDLLKGSDFVCLQAPLTDSTRHMIGAPQFALMKRDAILINGARGAIVDEPALIEALRTGTIAGAGLDVFEHEPLAPDSPLLQMDNVVALPHIGSATRETRLAMAQCAADNLIAGLTQGRWQNVYRRSS